MTRIGVFAWAVCCSNWFGLLPRQSIVPLSGLEDRLGELEPAQNEVLDGCTHLPRTSRRRNPAEPRAQPCKRDPPDAARNRLAGQLPTREPAPQDQEKH